MMKKEFSLLGVLGLGAGLMYLFDPDEGNRRRALMRDQFTRLLRKSDDYIEKTARDARNRARGAVAETMAVLSREDVSDWVLAERVRAEIGRVARYSSSIEVSADQGKVTLAGPIMADEVERVVTSVDSVRGVKEVNNSLEVFESADNIPGLQGQPQRRESRADALQENWSPTTRLVASVGGLAMTVTGLGKKGVTGTAMGLSGLGLAARGITNKPIGKVVGIGGGRNAVNIHKTINIDAPVEEVYRFWEDIENFPRFMEHVKEVSASDGHSHWRVTGPAGMPIEFDAITTKKEENREIAWKSQPNEPVKSAGIVQFEPTPTGGTRVTVRMSYNPVAGELGHAVASLFGTDPKQAMDDDLVRMKSLIEEGKATAKGEEVTKEEVAS